MTFPRSAPITSDVYEAKEAQLLCSGFQADMKPTAKLINHEAK